jgi:hypothetical protein
MAQRRVAFGAIKLSEVRGGAGVYLKTAPLKASALLLSRTPCMKPACGTRWNGAFECSTRKQGCPAVRASACLAR